MRAAAAGAKTAWNSCNLFVLHPPLVLGEGEEDDGTVGDEAVGNEGDNDAEEAAEELEVDVDVDVDPGAVAVDCGAELSGAVAIGGLGVFDLALAAAVEADKVLDLPDTEAGLPWIVNLGLMFPESPKSTTM